MSGNIITLPYILFLYQTLLGTFLNTVENVCFFFAGSIIFLHVDNVSRAFVFVTCNHEMITPNRIIELFRHKQTRIRTGKKSKRFLFAMF